MLVSFFSKFLAESRAFYASFYLNFDFRFLIDVNRLEDYVCIAVGIIGSIACTLVSIWQWSHAAEASSAAKCLAY